MSASLANVVVAVRALVAMTAIVQSHREIRFIRS
jgi:hypothetical protein